MSTEKEKKDEEFREQNQIDYEIEAGKTVENTLSNVKDRLKAIDEKYEADYPVFDEASLPQFKEASRPTQSEIQNIAKEKLADFKASNTEAIEKEFQNDMTALEIKKDKILSTLNNSEKELKNDYENSLESNQAKLISQGIERSSIAQNVQTSTTTEYENDLKNLIDDANRNLDEINLKRSVIRNEMNIALDKFDIAYASELEDKISELNKEYDNRTLEIEKYNKEISELRAKRREDWQKWANKVSAEVSAKKGYDKTVYVIAQLQGLNKDEALQILNDAEVIASLGTWYNAVIDYVNRNF